MFVFCRRLYGDIQAILANLLLTDEADNADEEPNVGGGCHRVNKERWKGKKIKEKLRKSLRNRKKITGWEGGRE